jgi:hypothetical protein
MVLVLAVMILLMIIDRYIYKSKNFMQEEQSQKQDDSLIDD